MTRVAGNSGNRPGTTINHSGLTQAEEYTYLEALPEALRTRLNEGIHSYSALRILQALHDGTSEEELLTIIDSQEALVAAREREAVWGPNYPTIPYTPLRKRTPRGR